MATKLGIYKRIALILEQETISTLTDDTKLRYSVDSVYDDALLECLQEANWNFACRNAKIEASPSASTAFGYEFVFDKPNDWLRTAGFSHDEFFRSPVLDYEDITDYWLANVDTIYAKWVSSGSEYGGDLTKWPPSYFVFVCTYIASLICTQVTGSSRIMAKLEKALPKAEYDAKNKDAIANPVTRFPPEGGLVRARTGGYVNREGRYKAG